MFCARIVGFIINTLKVQAILIKVIKKIRDNFNIIIQYYLLVLGAIYLSFIFRFLVIILSGAKYLSL